MTNKIYYLSSCDTCRKIMKEINATARGFELQDIKTNPPTAEQLDELRKHTGSYESLFSKRAQLYKELGLAHRQLTEKDYRKYLLEHYTFLKRPVIIYKDRIFIGSDKTNIDMLKEALL